MYLLISVLISAHRKSSILTIHCLLVSLLSPTSATETWIGLPNMVSSLRLTLLHRFSKILFSHFPSISSNGSPALQSSHVILFHLYPCLWVFSCSKQSCSCNLGSRTSGFQFFSCQVSLEVQVTLFNGNSPLVTWWNKVYCFHKFKARSKRHLLFLGSVSGEVEATSVEGGL